MAKPIPHAVNFLETKAPPGRRRKEAKLVEEPAIEVRSRREDEKPEGRCPKCGAWRPGFCISLTESGWLGDCCISLARRETAK